MSTGTRCLILAVLVTVADGCGQDYSRVANLDAPGNTIVCFGDSITKGYGATPGNDYPAVLSRLIGRPVVNAGVNGDTTASGLARLESDVLSHRPRVVVVNLGGNDFLEKVSKSRTLSQLDSIVRRITEAGAIVVLVHSKFGLFSDPYEDGFTAIAKKYNAVLVEDSLRGILGNPSRMYDPIHPNDAGYALLAERVSEVLIPLLDAADATRSTARAVS